MIVIYLVIKINFKSKSFIFNFDTFKYVFIVYKNEIFISKTKNYYTLIKTPFLKQ